MTEVLKFKALGEMVQRSTAGGGNFVRVEDFNAQTNLLVEAQDYIQKLEALSVTKIMLDIVPGDGSGHEVYAKSVAEVEQKLGDLYEQLDALQVEPGKYDLVLKPFLRAMELELHANSYKGDRPAWLKMTAQECMLEIFYHAGKLHKAVHDAQANLIMEYAADVANLSMMLTDLTGALAVFNRDVPAPLPLVVELTDRLGESGKRIECGCGAASGCSCDCGTAPGELV